jgi:hypothetical protein
MKAYLSANTISVLSDYDYYYLAKTDDCHAAGAYIHPKDFYNIMAEIFQFIKKSDLSSEDKNKVMKIFLERHFDFSRTKNFTIKHNDYKDREEWMYYLHKFITENVPENIDDLVKLYIKIKLILIRHNDLDVLYNFELENKESPNTISFIDGKVIHDYKSLRGYKPLEDCLNVSSKIRFYNFIEKMVFENNNFIISGRIRYNLTDKTPNLKCFFIHRVLKTKKYFTMVCKDNSFKIIINLDEFTENYLNLGIWDIFFEIEDFDTKKPRRVGNNKNDYIYPKNSSYFIHTFDLIQITPFFTNYNNLSFNIRKNPKLDFDIKINEFSFIKLPFNIFLNENLELFCFKSKKLLSKVFKIENSDNGAILSFTPKFNNITNFFHLLRNYHIFNHSKLKNNGLTMVSISKSSKYQLFKYYALNQFDRFIFKSKSILDDIKK